MLDAKDYHLISLKFLYAILLALFFAFLFVFVFIPETKDSYPIYSFERESIADSKKIEVFSENKNGSLLLDLSKQENFETELKNRSFQIMEATKGAVLIVLTSNHLDRINGLQEKEELLLTELKMRLNNESEELLQQKRQELEAKLSDKLQTVRRNIREKYSDYSQQKIRDNYLKIINLRIAVEVLASNESEKEKYQSELKQVQQQQNQLLAEKNSVLNEDISAETRTLIMDFNREYAEYRQQLENRHQELIAAREAEIEEKVAAYRQEIKAELSSKRKAKAAAMDQLIAKSRKYY
jgi:galactitol-specific phosphotransferase system IIB component